MTSGIIFRHKMPVQIRFSDVDQFGHMNNSVYFSLYDLAKTSYIKEVLGDVDWTKSAIVVANINANFFTPVFFNDEIIIETTITHLGKTSFTLLQRAVTLETNEVKCECKTVMVFFDLVRKEPKELSYDDKLTISAFENKDIHDLEQKK